MRSLIRSGVATATAFALVLVSAVAAHAEVDESPEITATQVEGAVRYVAGDPAQLPAVESEIGRGARLSTVPGATVPLGVAAGYDSALVRVSVLSPEQHTIVHRSGGVAALETDAGVSASTAVLLPIDGSGAAELWANAEAEVRIEVLAAFDGTQRILGSDGSTPVPLPGATLPLIEPVLRADTEQGLGGTSLSAAPITVGLLGQGGIPSDDVRSVYVTARVTLDRAGVLELGAQRVPLPAGATTLTTILAPEQNGAVHVRVEGAHGHLQLHAIGWIAEAPSQSTQLSLEGSFVPTARLDEQNHQTLHAKDEGPVRDDFELMARNADAVFSLGLVTLTPTAETETTHFDFGPAYEGRSRGVVVDRFGGAAPQLVLVPAGPDADGFTLSRGGAILDWLPVGDILGEEHLRRGAELAIDIDTHSDGQAIDLSNHGYFVLGGPIVTSAQSPSIDRVEVSGPEGLIGTADVVMRSGELRWEFDASAPIDGNFTYSVEVFDRGGNSRTADVELAIESYDEDDTVIASDLWVLNDGDTVDARLVEGEDDIAYVSASIPLKPGDGLVAGESEWIPEGLFAEVVSFDRIGEEWRVRTTTAAFEDVFYQVDLDEQDREFENLEKSDLDNSEFSAGIEMDGEAVEVTGERLPGNEGGELVEVVSGSDIDLDPYPDTCDHTGSPDDPGACPPIPEEDTLIDGAAASGGAAISPAVLSQGAPGPRIAAEIEASQAFGFKANVQFKSKKMNFRDTEVLDIGSSSADPVQTLAESVKNVSSEGYAVAAIALSAQAVPKLTIVLKTEITWKWGVIPTGVNVLEFKIALKNTLKADVTLMAALKYEGGFDFYNDIVSISLPTFTFAIGPVPVVIQNKIEVVLRASLEAEVSGTFTLGVARTDVFGTKYTPDKGWESLSEPSSTSFLPLGFKPLLGLDLAFKGSLTAGPSIEPRSALYGIAGPQLKVKLQAGVAGELKWDILEGKVTLSAELFAELKIAVTVKMKLFTLEWDRTLKELKFKFILSKGEWPIAGGSSTTGAALDRGGGGPPARPPSVIAT